YRVSALSCRSFTWQLHHVVALVTQLSMRMMLRSCNARQHHRNLNAVKHKEAKMLRKTVPLMIVICLMLLAIPQVTHAAAPACAKDVSIQADDWLSKVAEKELGAVGAYPAAALGTNMKHEEE